MSFFSLGKRFPAHGCLLLAKHDWCFKVNVYQDDELLFARLKEQVLDIAE
jgi:hypothetical protein